MTVAEVQAALNDLGFDAGPVDDIWGNKSAQACRAFQLSAGIPADGVPGPQTQRYLQRALAEEPTEQPEQKPVDTSGMRDWQSFVPFLNAIAGARYDLTDPQIPQQPPGVNFLSKIVGKERTNCSTFTAYLLGCGFDVEMSKDDWLRWQIAKGLDADYAGYGPGVCVDLGIAEWATGLPRDGVYLMQSFTNWPAGHSWLVLDYDPQSDKVLTLEANSKGNIDGAGFWDAGSYRDVQDLDCWTNHVSRTWTSRMSWYSSAYMCRLNIDHSTVKDWLRNLKR